jgi:hypothetical protein
MIAPDSDPRDVLPESDASTWPAWTDNWYWEPTDAAPPPSSDDAREPAPNRYTPESLRRAAAIAAAPHVD